MVLFSRVLAVIAAAFIMTVTAGRASAQTVIVDNADPGFSIELGTWQVASATNPKYGADYAFASTTSGATPTARCRFTPNLPQSGFYNVSVYYNTGGNRTTNAPYTIHGANGDTVVTVNQQQNGGEFYPIGSVYFNAGTGGSVSLANNANNSVVMADAVRWEYAGAQGPPEYRGLWVSRFEWPRSTESATKARLDEIIGAMASANFNALFLQVRGAMDCFYPSPNEPWAKETFNYQPRSYDPMAYAISRCHALGLEFHAYINTHAITQGTAIPNIPAGSPQHPFHRWGDPRSSVPEKRSWVMHNNNGLPQPLGTGEENYNWAAPGVPAFMQWTREQVMYVAENYNVNGVHFDRIRFSGQGSYDPISLQRSASGSRANPNNLSFRNWQRDQVTRLLNDMYGAVAEVNYNRPPGKPYVQVSTAPFRGKSQQESVNQMLGDWSGLGAQDFFVPQVYTSTISAFNTALDSNFPLASDRFVVAGLGASYTGTFQMLMDQVASARNRGAKGHVIFSYTSFNGSDLATFGQTMHPNKASTPPLPWIETPTYSTIVGTVHDVSNNGLLDVHVKRNGSTYTWLSGADGFYSMLKVPANQAQTLTLTHPGLPTRTISVAPLAPGEVRRINVTMGGSGVSDWSVY